MISSSLNEIFQKSILFAKQLRHEYLTIEHVFYLLLSSQEGATIISSCGGDIIKMREDLSTYIKSNIDALPKNIDQDPYESVALSRLIDNMVRHIQSAQQPSANIGDLIAAMYEEENTFSYMLLNQYNISRLDVLELISHSNVSEEKTIDTNSYLEKYTIDLLSKAKEGKIDPVIGEF